METVADRIKKLRKYLAVNQTELGVLAGGLTKSAVSQWERGETEPGWDALLELQKNKGINPAWVQHGTGDMQQANEKSSTLVLADGTPVLTSRERVLLGYFNGLTDAQQDEVIRELQEKKQLNEELLAQLLARRMAS